MTSVASRATKAAKRQGTTVPSSPKTVAATTASITTWARLGSRTPLEPEFTGCVNPNTEHWNEEEMTAVKGSEAEDSILGEEHQPERQGVIGPAAGAQEGNPERADPSEGQESWGHELAPFR